MRTDTDQAARSGEAGFLVVDVEIPWRLSHVLRGHTQDVKSVSASVLPGDDAVELIHSASRDETARSWYRRHDGATTQAGNVWQKGATYAGKRYQNAVVHVPNIGPAGLSILGGLDSRILSYETLSTASEKPQSKPKQVLNDHYDNVCHLSSSTSIASNDGEERTLLISASWDATARVYEHRAAGDSEEGWRLLHTLKGHERAVWDAKVVCAKPGEERHLTTSADLFIRLWRQDKIEAIYVGHTDVVRGLAILPPCRYGSKGEVGAMSETEQDDGSKPVDASLPKLHVDEDLFVTSSNDGSLRVWSLDENRRPDNNKQNGGDALRTLVPGDSHDASLIYDVASLGYSRRDEGLLVVSCGEDGLLRGWNVNSAQVDFSIPQPVTSVWSVAVLPISGDIVTGSSDGLVRVFTQRTHSEKDANEQLSVSRSHSGDLITEVNKDELEEHLRLCDALSAKRRVQSEVVQAESNGDSNVFEGKEYDAILRIDVSDDAEPLPLPINRGDDPRSAAKTFLQMHGLPESYEDQIVEFISLVGPDAQR